MSNIVPKDLKISLRTADQTRRAELDLADASLGSEVIQSAVDNWALPADTDYSLVNTTTGEVLSPDEKLAGKVREGDVLEVQPVLVAGAAGLTGATAAACPCRTAASPRLC